MVAVVPIPRSSGLFAACWKIDQFAFSAASHLLHELRRFRTALFSELLAQVAQHHVDRRRRRHFTGRGTTHPVRHHEQRRRWICRLFDKPFEPERFSLAQVDDDERILVMLARATNISLGEYLNGHGRLRLVMVTPRPRRDHVFPGDGRHGDCVNVAGLKPGRPRRTSREIGS